MIELNDKQQRLLLKLARLTIENKLKNNNNELNWSSEYSDEIFLNKCGAFVTLHKQGELRGCIGYIEGVKSIVETIHCMSLSAAFRDPRFPALTKNELPLIDIEISILSPVEKVYSLDSIEIGRDGLIITNSSQRGLLLPQVATEYDWDLTTFLEHTCEKAGLPSNAYTWEDTLIEKFSAQIFNEKEKGLV